MNLNDKIVDVSGKIEANIRTRRSNSTGQVGTSDGRDRGSRIKRYRASRASEERRTVLKRIVAEMAPMTVRQVFYQATVRGIVEKTEGGYAKVQTDLAEMRRVGELPFGWIRRPHPLDAQADYV